MDPKPLISDALAAFLESGLSVTVGTRDGLLNPGGARAWAVRIHEDREHLTVFLYARAATAMLRNLEAHPEIALGFDRPIDNRACQVKGLYRSSRRARPAERAEVERQVDGFLTQLETIGIPRAATAGWTTWPCTAITLRVTQLFEQTPGPGAGEPLR
jgi:hypothetical protein